MSQLVFVLQRCWLPSLSLLVWVVAGFFTDVMAAGICQGPVTLISTIQGNTYSSSEVGKIHTVEAIVVGDYQTLQELNGFFIQEESQDQDQDPTTSEGIFILDSSLDVNLYDIVQVTGTVRETNNLTQIRTVSQLQICNQNNPVIPQTKTLAIKNLLEFEALESMWVQFSQTLNITNNQLLGLQGVFTLSNADRLYHANQLALPGTPATELGLPNPLNRLLIDDASTQSNPPRIKYPSPNLSATNSLRMGDQIASVNGILSDNSGHYRLHSIGSVLPIPTNPRPQPPLRDPSVTLRVAAFNLMNYFNGDGLGSGFTSIFGANSLVEFQRQREKILQTLVAFDADVIGLNELENDGYGDTSALQDLLRGLNNVAPAGVTYSYIHPRTPKLGTQATSVAILYRQQTVKSIGSSATLQVAPFGPSSRQPLLQEFEEIHNGKRFNFVINHFKSKICSNAAGLDLDYGQGCWNNSRTLAAKELLNWLATQIAPEAGVIIMGDLNSYAKEDPISTFQQNGYTDMIEQHVTHGKYTYVYQGVAGYIDHALANSNLVKRIQKVTLWHINADEPDILDYNLEGKTPEQTVLYYQNSPARSSDHDPVLVDFQREEPKTQLKKEGGGIFDGVFMLLLSVIAFSRFPPASVAHS